MDEKRELAIEWAAKARQVFKEIEDMGDNALGADAKPPMVQGDKWALEQALKYLRPAFEALDKQFAPNLHLNPEAAALLYGALINLMHSSYEIGVRATVTVSGREYFEHEKTQSMRDARANSEQEQELRQSKTCAATDRARSHTKRPA